MSDRPVGLGCVVAVLLWLAVVVLALLSVEERNVYLITVACPLSAAAATLTIRSFFVSQNKMFRAAFELGQDAGRMEGRPEVPAQRGMYPVR